MGVLPACLSMHGVYAVPENARRGSRIPGTGVTEGYGPPSGCWEPNSDSVQEQEMLLTTELAVSLPPSFSPSPFLSPPSLLNYIFIKRDRLL